MKLKRLIDQIEDITLKGSREVEITGITECSHLVSPGNLFVAKRGLVHDGTHFIPDAVAAGAAAILTDLYDPFVSVTQLIHSDILRVTAQLAAHYYHHPSKGLKMVGITGTNGKTTTSFLVHHILEGAGIRAGLIGTVDRIVGHLRFGGVTTTPDVITSHKLLREMVVAGSRAAVMEVSSHGLDQGRVAEIDFDVAAFTNLSEEHLDYHGSMEAYKKAKGILFEELSSDKVAIFNADDPTRFETSARVLTYGIDRPADLVAEGVQISSKRLQFLACMGEQWVSIVSQLIGRFNVSNILAAIAICSALGVSLERCAEEIKTFGGVSGRLQRIKNKLNLDIVVDFAHSPDALEHVLKVIRILTEGRVIAVFGAGGDRDRGKRPLMGRVAGLLADICIITTDNPRSEDPQEIADAIAAGFEGRPPIVELDRKRAIQQAIKMANPEDVILIAGKGHEKEQIFAHQVVPFDDVEIVREICREQEGICG